MFFLGISAHLMIYLLVPAFLIVFFYFKGIPGSPEAGDLLPVVVAYEHPLAAVSDKSYVYTAGQQAETSPSRKTDYRVCEVTPKAVCPVYTRGFYKSPLICNLALRAPPFC